MDTIEFLTVILLISASALSVALIYFIFKVVKSAQSISADIHGLSYKLDPLIHSTFMLSEKLTRVTDEAESQLQISKSIISDIRDRTDKILNIETKIRSRIEDTVVPLLTNFQALRNGISSFWKTLKGR